MQEILKTLVYYALEESVITFITQYQILTLRENICQKRTKTNNSSLLVAIAIYIEGPDVNREKRKF